MATEPIMTRDGGEAALEPLLQAIVGTCSTPRPLPLPER